MTTIGGLRHAPTYLFHDFVLATTLSVVIVPGGSLVFAAGILIGNA